MRVPTDIKGLQAALVRLGYSSIVRDVDFSSPDAKAHVEAHLQNALNISQNTWQDRKRYTDAMAYVQLFQWSPSTGPTDTATALLRARDALTALLEEEQVLEPVDVVDYEENEEGDVTSIQLLRSSRAVEDARQILSSGQMNWFKRLLSKPPARPSVSFGGRKIPIIPWVDFQDPDAEDDGTSVVLLSLEDMSWYGPYSSPALGTRQAWRISTRGDTTRRRVPIASLRMIAAKDWPLVHEVSTQSHRFAASADIDDHGGQDEP